MSQDHVKILDVLHPLAELDWQSCRKWSPFNPTCCAVLNGTVCIVTRCSGNGDSFHFCSTPELNQWETFPTDFEFSSLTTFQSRFVSIGGYDHKNQIMSNEIRWLQNEDSWEKSVQLPKMNTERKCVSSISIKRFESECLVAAGGKSLDRNNLSVVEILFNNHWIKAKDLPGTTSSMKCTVYNGYIFFLSDRKVIYCNFEELFDNAISKRNDNVWKVFETDYHKPLVIISFGQRLITVDQRATVRAYDSKNTWITVPSKNNISSIVSKYMIAAVVHTGDLIIGYGGDAIFKVNLTVSSYNGHIMYKRGSLLRLEAAMGRKIISDSGMCLSQVVDQKISPHDIIEENLFRKYSNPTWENFLDILQINELKSLAELIENFLKDDTLFEDACFHYIEQNECLEMYFIKLLFLGPTGLGKTTVLKRLVGEISNISSSSKFSEGLQRTGVVETSPIFVTGSTSLAAGLNWCPGISIQDESCILLKTLLDSYRKMSGKVSLDFYSFGQKAHTPPAEKSMPSSSLSPHSKPMEDSVGVSKFSQSSSLPSFPTLKAFKWISVITKEAKESMHSTSSSYEYNKHFKIQDTGGQPEFMDLIPALTVSPGIYFLFLNLQYGLDDIADSTGNGMIFNKSTHTVLDIIMSELSSIYCLSQKIVDKDMCFGSKLDDAIKNSKPIVFFIGTHKDEASDEHILKLNKDLEAAIKDSYFYEKDIVHYPSEGRLIFAVDNMNGGDDEIVEMKELLDTSIQNHCKKWRIPLKWLLFSISLRLSNKRYASYHDCLELSSNFMMLQRELEEALLFLHHVGVLMYFRTSPHLIILDNQIIIDSISKIIFNSMKSDKIGVAAKNNLKENGIFRLEDLNKVAGEEIFDLVSPKELIIILEHLHLIAKISELEQIYIMPVLLPHLSNEEIDHLCTSIYNNEHIAPIGIGYKCGFVPTGVFPALIAEIIQNKNHAIVENKRNIVEFYFQECIRIAMIYCPKYILILVNIESFENVYQKTFIKCKNIRQEMITIFRNVHSQINYGDSVLDDFLFLCPAVPNAGHLCRVNEEAHTMYCQTCKTPFQLKSKHKVWFEEIDLTARISFDSSPTMSNLQCLKWENDGNLEEIRIIHSINKYWKTFCDIVECSPFEVESIEKKNPNSIDECCREAFVYWLHKQNKIEKSWQHLIGILNIMREKRLAIKLQECISCLSRN